MPTFDKVVVLSVLLTAIFVAVSSSLPAPAFLFSASIVTPVATPVTNALPETIKILFVGDIMLDRGVVYYSKKSAGEDINNFVFEGVKNQLLENDVVIANLEGPITGNESVSILAKPDSPEIFYFTFDPSWAETLFENNIRVVDLGNNHILNFGGQGLAETKKYLAEAGVDYFGAPDYPKSVTKEINGIKLAFVSYNEFASYSKIEADSTIEQIKQAKQKADIVVVFSHWGAEYVSEPADSIKQLARSFIDEGADLVIGSHPHVIQPVEIYKEKRIYYSLGNFIFDQYFSEETKKGLGVSVKIAKTNNTIKLDFEEINFYTQPTGQTVLVEK